MGEDENQLRASALQTAQVILQARKRSEEDLVLSKQALEQRTKELAASLALMQATLESTTDGILFTDGLGKVTNYNPQFGRLWGLTPETFSTGKELDVMETTSRQLKDPRLYLGRIQEIVSSKDLESFDLLELNDGRMIERYSRLQNEATAGKGRVWSFRNVTARMEGEILARRLAAIVESSDDAIVSKDLTSIVRSWNTGAQRIFGYSAEEMIGTSIKRLIPPDCLDEEDRILSRIRRGERIDHFETTRIAKGGKRLDVSVTVSPIKDSSGTVIGASKVARDITERKQAESRLREAKLAADQAIKAKDDFLAALSHELRTPLTPVLMTATALREDERLTKDVREQLAMIERNVALEAQLIDDLLDVTSIGRGKLKVRAQLCDAHSLIGLSLELVRDEILVKEISLEREFSAQRSGLLVDPARFQQVIWNLLRNAVKFTPRGGRILIRTSEEARPEGANWLRIEVKDSGIGIEAEALEQIFRPFEQAAAISEKRFGGLGLGLAIARAIVELHGGKISAQSQGTNQGSNFIVTLPGAVLPPQGLEERDSSKSAGNPAETARPAAGKTANSTRLLVVEDHAPTLQVIATLLTRDGYHVVTATNIADALVAAKQERFDVVISDLGLPDGTGGQLMEQLRDRHGLKGIALSGYGREEDIARSRSVGFVAHLVKPVRIAELRQALQEVVR